nr:uncharacterized protein LOC122273891 [Parasteatoda tepidariorum]
MGRTGNVFKKRKAFNFAGRKSKVQCNHVDEISLDNSTSSRKISSCDLFENLKDEQTSRNIIIELDLLSAAFENVACKDCGHKSVKINLVGKECGLAVKLQMFCENCSFLHNFHNSSVHKSVNEETFYALNTRLVYSLRAIGKGASAAQVFCGLMNLPPPPTKFAKYNMMLKLVVSDVCADQ